VPGILERVHLGLRQRIGENVQAVPVEDEVAQAPAYKGGAIRKLVQAAAGFDDQRPRGIAVAQGNVLHEAQRADRIAPAGVRNGVGATDRSGQTAFGAQPCGAAREQVECTDQEAADPRIASQRQLPRHRLGRRQRKCGGVEHDQPLHLRQVRQRPAETDHAAPVVHDEREGTGDAERSEQGREVVDARLQRVAVRIVAGLVGQAHADMVGHDAAIAVTQAEHEMAPVVTP
jgi:hypothetical protein